MCVTNMRRAREKTKPTVKRPPMCTDPFGTVVNKTELLMDRTLSLPRGFNDNFDYAQKMQKIVTLDSGRLFSA